MPVYEIDVKISQNCGSLGKTDGQNGFFYVNIRRWNFTFCSVWRHSDAAQGMGRIRKGDRK